MARPGVSYEEVEKTAILIAGEGRIPTIEGIRMRLGTGSSTTLATHLRRWKAGNSDTRQLAMKENLPEEMVELMKGLWQRLRDESAMQVNVVRQTADRDTSELRATIKQLQQESNRLNQQHHIVLQEKNRLVDQQAVLESLIEKLKRENAVLSAKHEGVSQQLSERETRIMELQHLHRQTQENLEHYRRASLEQHQMDNVRHEEEKQELKQTVAQIKAELGSLKQTHSLLQRDHDRLAVIEVSLQSQLEQATKKYSEAHTAYSMLEVLHTGCAVSSAEMQKKCEAVQQINEQNVHEMRQLENRCILSEQQLTETKAALEDVRAQIMLLAQEKWELGQEKGILLGQLKQLAMTVPLAG